MLAESLKIAWKSLRQNRMRAWLTMLGIIVGIASVITVVALGRGGQAEIMSQFNEIGASTAMISVSSARASQQDRLNEHDVDAIRHQLSGIKYASMPVQTSGILQGRPDDEHSAFMIGVDEDYVNMMSPVILAGRIFTAAEYQDGRSVIILDESTAKTLFGDAEGAIGRPLNFEKAGKQLHGRVIGVVSYPGSSLMASFGASTNKGAPLLFDIPRLALENAFPGDARPSGLMIMAKEPSAVDELASRAIRIIERRHDNAGQNIYASQKTADILGQVQSVLGIITTFISVVAGISLLVGGIGVMNIMLVSVTERTREIGIRKALGATTRDILWQFLTESMILTASGGAAGILAGMLLARAVGYFVRINAIFSLGWIVAAVLFSSLIGLVFGLLPARRAAAMNPIDALRYE